MTGTPTAAGTYSFTIQATDAGANTGSRAYNVTISAAPLTINPASLPAGHAGTAYNQTVIASGGTGPYSYAVLSGSLPTGLSLNPGTGAITGTPSAGGTFNFTIQATDSHAQHRHARLHRQHRHQLADGQSGEPAERHAERGLQPDRESRAAAPGPTPIAVSAGALPAGLSLNAAAARSPARRAAAARRRSRSARRIRSNNFGTRAYNVNIGTNIADGQSGDAAGCGHGPALQRDGGRDRRHRALHLLGVGGRAAAGADAEPLERRDQRHDDGERRVRHSPSARSTSLGNTGSRAYSLTNRPDPALDPEVIGLVNAQVAAARRFASAQIDNISRHLESLHNFNPCSVDFGVSLPPPTDIKDRPYPGSSPYSPSPGNAARSYERRRIRRPGRSRAGCRDRRMRRNGGWASRWRPGCRAPCSSAR